MQPIALLGLLPNEGDDQRPTTNDRRPTTECCRLLPGCCRGAAGVLPYNITKLNRNVQFPSSNLVRPPSWPTIAPAVPSWACRLGNGTKTVHLRALSSPSLTPDVWRGGRTGRPHQGRPHQGPPTPALARRTCLGRWRGRSGSSRSSSWSRTCWAGHARPRRR